MAEIMSTVTPAPETPPDPSAKPFWKTSEFWISVVLIVCGQLLALGIVLPDSIIAKYIGLISSTLTGLGYTVTRVMLKTNATNAATARHVARLNARALQGGFMKFDLMFGVMCAAAIALGIFGVIASCGGKVTGKTVGADAIDCALHKDAIAALAPAADTLLEKLTTPDGHVDTNALVAAAGAFSVDVGGCVLTDAFTRATSKRTNGAGDTRSAELARAYERVRTEKLGGRTYRLAGSQ